MINSIIDNVSDQVLQEEAVKEAPVVVDGQEVDKVATEESVKPEATDDAKATEAEDNTPFPKKAVNKISRLDRKIGKLYAENASMKAKYEELLAKFPQAQTPVAPREEDYADKTVGEFLKDSFKFEHEQEQSQKEKQQEEAKKQEAEKAWVSEREIHVENLAREFLQSNPDAKELVEEYSDILDDFPAHVERAFLEAENAPLAFYTLAKEGVLEKLANMSPAQVAMAIGKAEIRGESLIKNNKQITKAPAPIAASRSVSAGDKGIEAMSGDELLKKIRKG